MRLTRLLLALMMSLLLVAPRLAVADMDLSSIIAILTQMNSIQLESIKRTGIDTVEQLKSLQSLLKGQHNYGARDYLDTHSWGSGSDQWQSALDAYKNGDGNIGRVAQQLKNEFPINPDSKTINPKALQDRYNVLQAKTALAARAASQLSFDTVNQQLQYHHKTLQPKIDTTDDIKSAMDLQNRLIFENNLIQLEILRQAAINNQQQAVETQADVNTATINHFFNSKLH